MAGDKYTIADIATWPWIARHEWHDIGLKSFENLSRWYLEIANREAVIRGYSSYEKNLVIPCHSLSFIILSSYNNVIFDFIYV